MQLVLLRQLSHSYLKLSFAKATLESALYVHLSIHLFINPIIFNAISKASKIDITWISLELTNGIYPAILKFRWHWFIVWNKFICESMDQELDNTNRNSIKIHLVNDPFKKIPEGDFGPQSKKRDFWPPSFLYIDQCFLLGYSFFGMNP